MRRRSSRDVSLLRSSDWCHGKAVPAAEIRLGSISKRGDPYLRTLLIHGARSVMCHAKVPTTWQSAIQARRPANVAAVAVAHKMARTAWAILAHGQAYQKDYVSVKPA